MVNFTHSSPSLPIPFLAVYLQTARGLGEPLLFSKWFHLVTDPLCRLKGGYGSAAKPLTHAIAPVLAGGLGVLELPLHSTL